MGRLYTGGTAVFLAIGGEVDLKRHLKLAGMIDWYTSTCLGFLFGYDSGIIASTIVQPYFKSYMGIPTSSETGGIVSSFTGGAILGALSVSWLPDKFGRKRTVFIGACISVFGCALQGGAVNIGMMIAGRLIAGIAVGLLSAVVPMYCVGVRRSLYRAKLMCWSQRLRLLKIEENWVDCCNSCCPGVSSLRNGLVMVVSKSTAPSNVSFVAKIGWMHRLTPD